MTAPMNSAPVTWSRSGVVGSATIASPRSTMNTASLPPVICTSVCRSVQVFTSRPFTETTRSPGMKPAFAAGVPSGTMSTTGSVVPNFAPGASESTTASTTASTTFIAGPATATAISFHGGIGADLAAAPPGAPSSALVPSGSTSGIDTYPPSGRQLSRYSTPRMRFFQIALPKPIENASTLRPSDSATTKWPNSWTSIASANKSTQTTM